MNSSNHETEEAAKPGLEGDQPEGRSNYNHGDDPIPRAAKLERPERKIRSDVSELPAELKELVEQMLVEGATFDETVEAVNERRGECVTLQAVKNFFRSNLGLQQQRIQKLVVTAEELKKAVGATDPDSPEGQLLGAIILTGVMQISREGANFDLRYAARERLARENLQLQQQKLLLQQRKAETARGYELARARATIAKAELLELQIRKLRKLFGTVNKKRKLDQKTYERIEEVYGLLRAPLLVEREGENSEEA
jgi:hypothetical protein